MTYPEPIPPRDRAESTPSILTGPELEIKVKGSRFVAQAFSIEDQDAAQFHISELRKRYHDATHHCWATRIHVDDVLLERADDDGEPSGSAGVPILGALQRQKVSEALCVVTRYFGGTKLGRGGLVRAYGDAARVAVESAPAHTIWHDLILNASCSFDDLGAVEASLARRAVDIRGVERCFDPDPHLRIQLRRDAAVEFATGLYELTGARIALDFEEC